MRVKLSNPLDIENQAIRNIERCYLKKSSSEVYLALEEINLVWDAKVVRKVIELWNDGKGAQDISKELCRPIEDVVALLLDLAIKKKLKEREGGIFGRTNQRGDLEDDEASN